MRGKGEHSNTRPTRSLRIYKAWVDEHATVEFMEWRR
jgi:hypothetical protein